MIRNNTNDMEFNLDTTIKELHEQGVISVRTFNCLHTAGYETLGIILDNIPKIRRLDLLL